MALPITSVTISFVTLQVMSFNMSQVNDIITYLSKRKSSVSCAGKNGLQFFMRELGFEDTPGDTPGHRIFTHEKLNSMAGFTSMSIDCGHKPKREMKMPYVVKTLAILRKYEPFLVKLELGIDDNA